MATIPGNLRDESRMLFPKKKKTKRAEGLPQPVDAEALLNAQSVTRAAVAATAAILVLSLFWMFFANVTGRVFPWFSIVQGIFIGLAVRRFGRGLDWRFSLLAGMFAWAGAFFGNLLVAIPATTSALDASWWEVIRGLTWWSLRTFFDEVISVVDYIYAFCAAAVAVFYARRRLNRHEVFALRNRQDG